MTITVDDSISSGWLFHFSAKVIDLWESAFASDEQSSSKLLESFTSSVNKLNDNRIFLSYEKNGKLIAQISSYLNGDVIELTFKHEIALFKDLYKSNTELKNIIYFPAPFPLFDINETKALFDIHVKYAADFSYGENLPDGTLPLIFGGSLLEAIRLESENEQVPESLPMSLKEYLLKNINRFQVEIHYSEPDLRRYRLDFTCMSRRSIAETSKFLEQINNVENPFADLQNILNEKSQILALYPSYIELELTSQVDFVSPLSPNSELNLLNGELSLSLVEKLCDELENSLQDTSIALSGFGEPTNHQDFTKIFSILLECKHVKNLVIETNGCRLSLLHQFIVHANFGKVKVIVKLNSLNNNKSIDGTSNEQFLEIKNELKNLSEKLQLVNEAYVKNSYLQVFKIVDNELEIDEMYAYCEELGFTFLLQKFNRYINLLPEKRVSDMTPLERWFCWHLRRDLVIRANGKVAYCKQDVSLRKSIGDFNGETIVELFSKQKENWVANHNGNYPEYPDCKNCDEYYTFNL